MFKGIKWSIFKALEEFKDHLHCFLWICDLLVKLMDVGD